MVSLLIFFSKQCIIKQLLDLVVGSIPILNSEFFFFFVGVGGGGIFSPHIFYLLWGRVLLSTHILFIIKTKVTRVKPLRAEETSSYDLGTQFS